MLHAKNIYCLLAYVLCTILIVRVQWSMGTVYCVILIVPGAVVFVGTVYCTILIVRVQWSMYCVLCYPYSSGYSGVCTLYCTILKVPGTVDYVLCIVLSL